MTRAGLMPVQRMVTRDGKTFQTTVWVKTKHANKVDKNKKIDIPKWDFKTHEEFKTEKERINKIDDRSERQVLKEALLSHVKDTMKVSWDVVPDTEDKAFARNFMRASSAAMKHLKANPKPAQPKVVVPTKASAQATATNNALAKPIGTTNIMSRDDSKAKAKEIRDKVGIDKLMATMEQAGIKWDKTSETGPNRMRALRAFAKFTRQGGELNFDGKVKVTVNDAKKDNLKPKPVPKKDTTPATPTSKFTPGTIEHTFENATPKQKLIGVVTGILPETPAIADYMENLVKSGQIDVTASAPLEAIKLPKKLTQEFNWSFTEKDFSGDIDGHTKLRIVHALTNGTDRFRKHFEGDAESLKAFDTYKQNLTEFKAKYGEAYASKSFESIMLTNNLVEVLNSVRGWNKKHGGNVIEGVGRRMEADLNKGKADEWYDLLGFDADSSSQQSKVFEDFIYMTTDHYGTNNALEDLKKYLPPNFQSGRWGLTVQNIKDNVANGTVTKDDVIEAVVKSFTSGNYQLTSRINKNKTVMENYESTSLLRRAHPKLGVLVRDKGTGAGLTKHFDEMIRDYNYFNTQDAVYIQNNVALARFCENAPQAPAEYKPIPKDLYNSGYAMLDIAKIHLTALKARSDKSREKIYSSVKPDKTKQIKQAFLMNKVDLNKMEFPDPATAKDFLKSSLAPVESDEAKKIEDKIHATHDRKGHGSFTTKVHGVYRIKDIAVEEKFQEINAKINTTGFYYHGTSFNSAQKILGLSGGFKVFTDSANIKAGSMLGYGIYLARESSKSMQYVGNGFRSGNRGVLFLCKASLGQVTPSSVRGFDHNQKLMNQSTTDTVFMDRPHVVNPEWAVKRAEQAVPRLWIDVERVSK